MEVAELRITRNLDTITIADLLFNYISDKILLDFKYLNSVSHMAVAGDGYLNE